MSDHAKLRDLHQAAPDYIDMETRGRPYMQYEVPADECKAFYQAAHAALPALLDEIEQLRANAVRMREYRFALEGIETDGNGNPLPSKST